MIVATACVLLALWALAIAFAASLVRHERRIAARAAREPSAAPEPMPGPLGRVVAYVAVHPSTYDEMVARFGLDHRPEVCVPSLIPFFGGEPVHVSNFLQTRHAPLGCLTVVYEDQVERERLY